MNPYSKNDSENSILAELHVDFEADGKVTVNDCLQSESSMLPKIVTVMNSDQLFETNRVLLNRYIDELQNLSGCNELGDQQQSRQPRRSSVWYLSRIATIIRFLHFVLEPHNRPLSNHNGENNETAHKNQVDKMVSTMLKKLSKAVSVYVKKNASNILNDNEASENDDLVDPMKSNATDRLCGPHLACFLFGSLLQIDRYAKARITLMAPLWKGLCEVASSTAPSTLPPHMLMDSIIAFSSYLLEGEKQAFSSCAQLIRSSTQVSLQNQGGQMKLIGFIVARIKILLDAFFHDGNSDDEDKLALHVFQPLLRLRGMPIAVQLLFSNYSRNMDGFATSASEFMKPYFDLSLKVEECLLALGISEGVSEEDDMFVPEVVGSLLAVGLADRDHKMDVNGTNEHEAQSEFSDGTRELQEFSLHLGKALTLQRFLKAWLDRPKHKQYKETDVESVLSICENLVCYCIPRCHVPLMVAAVPDEDRTNPSATKLIAVSLISRTIELIAGVVFEVDSTTRSLEASKRGQVHRLMIRWLASPINGRMQHPLHREVAISLVHLCVLQCAASDGGPESPRQRVLPMLSLLSKLLFDPRTDSLLRENIAAVSLRVLSSSITKEQMTAVTISELARHNRQPRKRKRGGRLCLKPHTTEDLKTIGNVLTYLKAGKLSSSKLLGTVQNYCRRLEASFVSNQEHSYHILRQQFSTLVLASIEGLFVNSPKDDFSLRFQQLVGMDFSQFYAIVLSWTERYHPSRMKESDFRPKKLWLLRSVLRFCCGVCEEFGYINAVSSIQDVVSIIEFCTKTPFNLVGHGHEASRQAIMMDAINLLGSFAKAIPPSCPGNVLQVSSP